jgi:hypothetical protein
MTAWAGNGIECETLFCPLTSNVGNRTQTLRITLDKSTKRLDQLSSAKTIAEWLTDLMTKLKYQQSILIFQFSTIASSCKFCELSFLQIYNFLKTLCLKIFKEIPSRKDVKFFFSNFIQQHWLWQRMFPASFVSTWLTIFNDIFYAQFIQFHSQTLSFLCPILDAKLGDFLVKSFKWIVNYTLLSIVD